MSYDKAVVQFPELKRVALGKKKPVFKDKVCSFISKAGKKMVIPDNHVVYCEPGKFIKFIMPTRKICKGSFEVKGSFLIDEDTGVRININILNVGDSKPKRTKEQKKADKARMAAMKAGKSAKKKKKSKKVKKKKK